MHLCKQQFYLCISAKRPTIKIAKDNSILRGNSRAYFQAWELGRKRYFCESVLLNLWRFKIISCPDFESHPESCKNVRSSDVTNLCWLKAATESSAKAIFKCHASVVEILYLKHPWKFKTKNKKLAQIRHNDTKWNYSLLLTLVRPFREIFAL